VFGPVAVPNPRWERGSCQTEGPKTFRPTAAWLKGRTSPERLYLEAKWGSLIPYEKVADLLKEVLPVSGSTAIKGLTLSLADRTGGTDEASRSTASDLVTTHQNILIPIDF